MKTNKLSLWNMAWSMYYLVNLGFGYSEENIYKICVYGFLSVIIILVEGINQLTNNK